MRQNPVEEYLQGVPDPLEKDILRLAAKKADSIAVSAIDTTMVDPYALHYTPHNLYAARTIGMDYARERMNGEAIFLMYDVDTVPQNNHLTETLIQIYRDHPDLIYCITPMAYKAPSGGKSHVSKSPSYQFDMTERYNTAGYPNSTQVSFRVKAADSLIDIAGYTHWGFHGWEDADTAKRLSGFFADVQKGFLFYPKGMQIPVSLNTDRIDGTVDADARAEYKEKGDVVSLIGRIISGRAEIEKRIMAIKSPQIRQRVENERIEIRQQLERQQRVTSRFNKEVANAFVKLYESGRLESFYTDPTVVADVLKLPYGKALTHYLQVNKNLVSDLSADDIALVKYYLGKGDKFPENIKELTPFQKAMREYLGEYKSFDELKDKVWGESEGKYKDLRSVTSRETLLHPMFVEVMAWGYMYRRYFHDVEFIRYMAEPNQMFTPVVETETNDPASRREWIRKQLGTQEMAEHNLVRDFLEAANPLLAALRSSVPR